jgi:hypothetical protein
MKKIILSLLVVVSLTACTNHGKKVKVEGTKAEVYYKGDGVTEDDAKKTGEFLKSASLFNSGKGASVQITKEGEEYTIRLVYDKDVADTLKGLEDAFKLIGAQASKEVFGGKKVNIALANKSFKDYKTIPYDEAVAKSLEAPTTTEGDNVLSKEDFEHDTAGGVDFYWHGISDDESKKIADYIVQNGSFSGGTAELYMTKAGDRYLIRFPVVESSRTDATIIAKLDEVSKQIKDNVFPDAPFSFYMTDEKNNTVKAWDY